MKNGLRTAITVLAVLLYCAAVQGDIIQVPADYETIQKGIDAAVDGDTVEVAEGTYFENINFNGKAITVRSEDPKDPAVVETTVIEGNQTGRCVTFDSGEGALSVLSGFTLTRGSAAAGGGTIGGGIGCFSSSPTLTYNRIFDNNATYGGGIGCLNGSPLITDNIIIDNFINHATAGIYCESSGARIENNLLQNNMCFFGGGAIGCVDCSGILITGNTISQNYCHYEAGGIWLKNCQATVTANSIVGNKCDLSGGIGGGIYCEGGTVLISENELSDNYAQSSGGGIRCKYGATVVMEGNIFSNNVSGGGGGAVACSGSSITMDHNTLIGNRADDYGGIHFSDQSDLSLTNDVIVNNYSAREGAIGGGSMPESCSLQMTNCTIAGNRGDGVYIIMQQSVEITNCIIWGNSDDAITATHEITVGYSNVEEGWQGAGNIDSDPLFIDAAGGDYRISYGSPCIDSGSAVDNPRDREGDPRPLDGDSSGTAEYDMGADEYNVSGVDSDTDGLVDSMELSFGTDPVNADTDADGISDYDEVNWDGDLESYDPYDPQSGTGADLNATSADTDGDGYTDYMELESGTDPIDQESKPGIIRLNFQPASSDIPAGFLKDNGGGYTGRGYGWL